MIRKRTKDSFSHKLLKAIALSGTVIVAASSPYFGIRIAGAIQKEINRKKWREFYKAIYQLKNKNRLKVSQNNDGTFTLEITNLGKNIVKKYDLDNLCIKRPREWDGAWRIFAFDIPGNKKLVRQSLLSKLKELGFVMLQKSVWTHPFECREELAIITKAFGVENYVCSFIAYELDNEKANKLKKKFEELNAIKLV